MIPSKELLSEVLSKEFNFMFGISDVSTYNNLVQISFYETELCSMCGLHQINIYELAHKCKEWAKKKEYWAISGYDEGYFCMLHDMPDNRFFNASTEIEAIFKACEWIMEYRK